MKAHALTLLAVLAAAPAYADNALRPEQIPNKARQLADKGRRLHKTGDFTGAVAAFKEAYVLAPSPGLLFNIAQSYRLAGNCDESAWMYRRFLDTDPRGPQRDLAEQQLAVVDKCGRGGLRVTIVPPTMEAKAPAPGGPELAVRADVQANRRSHTLKTAGLWTAIGGGVVLAGAAYYAYDAHRASTDVEDTYRKGGKWEDVAATDARGQRSERLATALGVAGGIAVVSAAALYGLGMHYESNAAQLAVAPTGRGAQVSLSWGF